MNHRSQIPMRSARFGQAEKLGRWLQPAKSCHLLIDDAERQEVWLMTSVLMETRGSINNSLAGSTPRGTGFPARSRAKGPRRGFHSCNGRFRIWTLLDLMETYTLSKTGRILVTIPEFLMDARSPKAKHFFTVIRLAHLKNQ